MELSNKVAYLKGLMDGLKIDDSTPEGKILGMVNGIHVLFPSAKVGHIGLARNE